MTQPGQPRNITRRRALRAIGGVVVGVPVATGLYAWGIEPQWLRVTRRTMPIQNLPETWVGKTLVQISDLHIGPKVSPSYLKQAMRQVNALQPDLVVCTGDLIDRAAANDLDPLGEVLGVLDVPEQGVYACLGNHDFGERCSDSGLGDQVAAAAEDAGWRVLRNEIEEVAGLCIAGLEDKWALSYDPEPTLREMAAAQSAGGAGLVLCHNPDVCDEAVWAGYAGWILAGHTHGGQVNPPFLEPPLLPVKNTRYTAGVFDVGRGRTLHISTGVGYLWRVRMNCRPEVTAFVLRRA